MFCCFPGAAECGLKVINGCNAAFTRNPADGKVEVIVVDERRTVTLGWGRQRIQVTATADGNAVQRFTLLLPTSHEILNWMLCQKRSYKMCLTSIQKNWCFWHKSTQNYVTYEDSSKYLILERRSCDRELNIRSSLQCNIWMNNFIAIA